MLKPLFAIGSLQGGDPYLPDSFGKHRVHAPFRDFLVMLHGVPEVRKGHSRKRDRQFRSPNQLPLSTHHLGRADTQMMREGRFMDHSNGYRLPVNKGSVAAQ